MPGGAAEKKSVREGPNVPTAELSALSAHALSDAIVAPSLGATYAELLPPQRHKCWLCKARIWRIEKK